MSNRIDELIKATTDIHAKLQQQGFSDKQATTLTPGILITAGCEMICSEIEDLRSQQAMIAAVEAIKVMKVKLDGKQEQKQQTNHEDMRNRHDH